jgi:ubiquitin fusion degradation protein 1
MMQNLLLQVGDMVKFRNVSLPKGSYVKLQPVTSDFLDISNPKAVLERTLRSYSCLTTGDCFVVNYLNKNYEIEVGLAAGGLAGGLGAGGCWLGARGCCLDAAGPGAGAPGRPRPGAPHALRPPAALARPPPPRAPPAPARCARRGPAAPSPS